jgi:hypothetical protein
MVICWAGAYVGSFRQAVLDFLAYAALAEKLADAMPSERSPLRQ